MTANGSPSNPLSSTQNISYEGVQGGVDCGLLRIGGSDWNAHIGATGGSITGKVAQTDGTGSTDLQIPFFGAYAFARNGGFVFDFSARRDLITAIFTDTGSGLLRHSVDGTATMLSAYSSYAFSVSNTVTLTPYGGLSWSRSELGSFDTFNGVGGQYVGTVNPGTNDTSNGRLGVQISLAQQVTNTFFLQPFAGVSYWREIDDLTNLKYIVGNTQVDVTTQLPKLFRADRGRPLIRRNQRQCDRLREGGLQGRG